MKPDGLVYFIASVHGDDVRVKIGYTKGDPNQRLRNLQCGSPMPLGIYTAFPGNRETEKRFHETFAPLRLHGEWFAMKGKLRDFMICLHDDAMTRQPADMVHVLEAVELVILADEPIRDDDDPEEYIASADMGAWEDFRRALEAHDRALEAEAQG